MDHTANVFYVMFQQKMPGFPVSSWKFLCYAEASRYHSITNLISVSVGRGKQENLSVTTTTLTPMIFKHSDTVKFISEGVITVCWSQFWRNYLQQRKTN